MERFIADLHIHSPFSRATSKKLSPWQLAAWAEVKGINVLGTGDFTHPGWLQVLEESLLSLDNGLFKLKDKINLNKEIVGLDRELKGDVFFMLSAEISSIYKKNGKVRKIHNLVFVPSFEKAKALNKRLAQIGNLESDGRPILGLDAKDLLEMVLELDPKAFLIPAHIWTPWFSLFGSKSGFDSIEDCFEDLSSYIFALETGLSSDPEMNWMWSKLDRFFLVSNSDAHSGENLAREANIFSGDISYDGIFYALRGEGLSNKFLGTIEFYPEEGKYHLDGHRKCGVVLTPQETLAHNGICPVCGKKLTVGVLHRVLELADRTQPEQPKNRPGYTSLIPLKEIIGEFLQVGSKSKKVSVLYLQLITKFKSELDVLLKVPEEDLSQVSRPLGIAISRLRKGEVLRQPGFDGQYGKIYLFTEKELRELQQGKFLFVDVQTTSEGYTRDVFNLNKEHLEKDNFELSYNEEQKKVIAHPGPVLALAGPGTGKTHTLLGRVLHLLQKGVNPRHILVVTFTRKAAFELKSRLTMAIGDQYALPIADTLHALAYEYWQQVHGERPLIIDEADAKKLFALANPELKGRQLKIKWEEFAFARELRKSLSEEAENYFKLKKDLNVVDYLELLEFWLHELEVGNFFRPYNHILVDEIQDLSPLQLELVCQLSSKDGIGFFAIGDPKQSIYGFRGGVEDVTVYLKKVWSDLEILSLSLNYRSGQKILDLSSSLFGAEDSNRLQAVKSIDSQIYFLEAPSASYEAFWIADKIKTLLGGTSHLALDRREGELAPGDIAVLVRFKALLEPFKQALKRRGIPFSVPEDEAFYKDPRIEIILKEVRRILGLSLASRDKILPDAVITDGPQGIKNFLKDIPPFDPLFWESKPFRELEKLYAQEQGWLGVLNTIQLESELELVREKSQKVRIMTLHASKGLEFEAVFLPCLEDGILPFVGIDRLLDIERESSGFNENEEKRLFYVGMTRARKYLFLTLASTRKIYNKKLSLPKSRFLSKLDFSLIKEVKLQKKTKIIEKQRYLF
ncbi:MAG: 3'-5' exonuclease [Desulfonauticus sp.]|nr:3'-5' exonuclease [Desulfonauticus sp.]